MNAVDLIDDIPIGIARAAHRGTSFVPEDRAGQERSEYAATLASDFALLSGYADTPEKKVQLAEAFKAYRSGFRRFTLAMLSAKSRCVSTMITGASNFPTDRARKASDRADKITQGLVEWRKRKLDKIRALLTPELQPIKAGDSNAVVRLREKIAVLEADQQLMRNCNTAIRRGEHATLVSLIGSEVAAQELEKPDFAGRVGYADYKLRNNNANIRRLKQRLSVIEQNKAAEDTEVVGTNARLEDAPADNRVRLFFAGIPPVEVRSRLKASGFRWTPSLGCWQAYRNQATCGIAREIAGVDSALEEASL